MELQTTCTAICQHQMWVAGKWKRHQYFKIEIWGGWVGESFGKKILKRL